MLTLFLSNCGNVDYRQNPTKLLPNTINKLVFCKTLEECSLECRKYISENDLGGGNWDGGQVFNNGIQVAYISYNGRIWMRGEKYYKENENIKQLEKLYEYAYPDQNDHKIEEVYKWLCKYYEGDNGVIRMLHTHGIQII